MLYEDLLLVGFRNMSRERCKKLQSIELVSSTVFGGIGNDVVLDREFFKGWGARSM